MVSVPSYLARIVYSGPTTPTTDTLRAIHHAHLLTVPFENLDISLGHKIVVDGVGPRNGHQTQLAVGDIAAGHASIFIDGEIPSVRISDSHFGQRVGFHAIQSGCCSLVLSLNFVDQVAEL